MNKKRFIDLSRSINSDMPVYPGDSSVQIVDMNAGKKDIMYEQFVLHMGLHTGTHIDGVAHVRRNNNKSGNKSITHIADVPLDRLTGNGCLLDARGMHEIEYIAAYEQRVHENDVVLLYTGHDTKYGTAEYYKTHPVITEKLAQFFVDKKVIAVGIDAPSVESAFDVNTDSNTEELSSDIHRRLLDNNILILENLCNLDQLIDIHEFEVFFFPLKIAADSSPLRVVVRVL